MAIPDVDQLSGLEDDPNGIGSLVATIPASDRAERRTALVVAGMTLGDERVLDLVVGAVSGHPGVALRTERSIVVTNGRQWAPDVRRFDLDANLAVHGWAQEGQAILQFESGGRTAAIGRISDVDHAQEFAAAVRQCVDSAQR